MKISVPDATLSFHPQFISVADCRPMYEQLSQTLNWRQDEIKIYGKWVKIPRLQAWYSEEQLEYTYSGLTMIGETLPPLLQRVKQQIEQFTECQFNAVLANLYRNGDDTVGWHSDDEPELGAEPVIASLSLGDTRNFQLKHKITGQKLNVDLTAGSLLVMSGKTQAYWSHCLPRTKRVKSPRINLTFRQIFRNNSALSANA